MTRSIKMLCSTISVMLCILIAFTLPTQVFAQNITLNEEEIIANNPQESDPYQVGNIIGELTNEREEYSKQFRLDDGTYMAVSYAQPIHFKDENGKWIDYDNSLTNSTDTSATNDESSSEEYTNKQSDIKVNYSKKSKENNMVKIKSADYQVSWGYADTNKVKATIVTNEEELEGNDKYTTLKNLTSEVIYENAYNNVDIQYITTSIGIKENIILKNSDAQTEFEIQYKINSLTANSVNEKLIELSDKSGNVVYSIETPYMIDADGKTSTQLSMTIVDQKNSKLTLKLSADKEFLSECKYPVTIDPTFYTDQDWQTSECTYANSAYPGTAYGYESTTGYTGTVYVGTYGSGMYRSYFKMKSLPTLNNGDMIVGAYLNMHLYNNDFYNNMYIGAYYLSESWSQSTLTWNNKPDFESEMIDYETLVANDSTGWHDWDVTKCVKRWYNGESNNGIMLKAHDETTVAQAAGFYSSNYPSSSVPRPLFKIVYRNNKGLEDYWTYSSFAVGTAGTAYVNDYSGNLVFVTSGASTASGYAPASVQNVYNGYMAGEKYTTTKPYVGRGWKLNIQQTLLPSSNFTSNEELQENYPYVYTDEDGTDHYFYKKTEDGKTTYLDEDGLGLELTINSSDLSYTIKDEKDNKLIFNNNGYLVKTTDSNGNSVTINFADDGKTITSVTDASNNTIELNQTTGSTSGYMRYIVDPAKRQTTYTYSTEEGKGGRLLEIANPDGTKINFTYDDEGSLISVTDVDGYKVTFTYTSTTSGKKVSAIEEMGSDGTAGQKITFDRTQYNTTVINTYGSDGVSGTNDDLTSTYQFDEFGRTVSIKSKTKDRDLGASVYQYTDGVIDSSASNIKQLNRVSTGYSTGSNPVNLINNSNMEATSNWAPASWGGTNTFTMTYDSSQSYFGQKSMKINVTAYEGDSRGRAYQDFSNTVLEPGHTYTLSGYIKTVGVTNGSENAGALLCAESFNSDDTSTLFYTDFILGNTTEAIDNGWQRVSKTFTIPDNSSETRINLALRASTGTAYFDGIQIEEYGVANNYNMLENAGFENYSSNGLPTGWTDHYSTLDSSVDFQSTNHHHQGSSSFRIKGDAGTRKALKQTVKVSGTENDTYIISGWARATAVAKDEDDTRKFKISVNVNYSDGTTVVKSPAEFNHSVSDWQFTSAAFNLSDNDSETNKTPVSITIYLSYQYQGNYAYFDNVCLEKDNAQSYTYDDDGNLVTVVDNSEEKSKMEYVNSDLTKSIDAKGYAYEYEYEDGDTHNMTKATSQTGMNYNYTYNSRGLATNLEVKGYDEVSTTEENLMIKTDVSYDSTSGLLTSASDQDGKIVEYSYDAQKGTLNSVTDKRDEDNNVIVTEYDYDSDTDLLNSVTQTDDYGDTYSLSYSYSDDGKFLKTISHNNSSYNIDYDEFGNKTDSKVGTQSLASYAYNSGNGAMTSSTYGTGQTVSYTYDQFGNESTRYYNGTKAFTWHADRSGSIIREKDYLNNYQYDYTYDSTGRLVRKTAKDTSVAYNKNSLWYNLEYGYDLNNNITKFVYRTPQRGVVSQYEYGLDNLLSKFYINNTRSVSYEYDSLNRLEKTSLSTDRVIDTTYTYYDSERISQNSNITLTTSKLETETIDGVTYKYIYDAYGNITHIQKIDGNTTVNLYYYEYDSMNQLTYVRDYANSKIYSYSYDSGGNLLVENISDVNSYGTATNTQSIRYAYGDSNWTDKLTSYNGQTITYDAIGNPLTYRDGMTMSWKNGRQLATLQDDVNDITYNYDSNSVRISKTVNGVKYTYAYINGMLMYETRGDAKFYYSYDSNGILYSVKYTLTDDSELLTYYYTHNSRGDIIGIYNGSGDLKAHYEYDAWGNILSITDADGNAITSATHVGNLNPFRYRGYYYDSETGLYYLMSRYYDPVTHRFLNADGYFQSGGDILDLNMSAYCRNNPISFVDPTGTHACGDPTCTICRADRRDFINNNLDWYNRITGKNVDSVNYDGTIYYKDPITIDKSATEYKVIRTVVEFFSSFEASGDVGVGIGYSTNICKIVELGAVSKVSGYAELSGHDGIDVGIYTGNSFDASIWDIGPNYELSSSYSVITKETIPDVGSTRTISFSNSKYFGIGYSYSIGFNYGYFSDEMAELWR